MSEKKIDFVIVLIFLWRWKYYLIGISIFAGLAGAIFSAPLFIAPKFKSTVIFYPTTSMSVSKGLLKEQTYGSDDFLSIGESEEVEQLMQILQSDVIMDEINKKYDLMSHYKIDINKKYAYTKFARHFRSNVKSAVTQYMSIKVSVLDEDPHLAAYIANDVVEIMDSIRNNIQKQRAFEGLAIVEQDYEEKKIYIQSIVDSLKKIAKAGVLKFDKQSQALTEAYTRALQSGNSSAIKAIEEKLDILSKYGPAQEMLSNELEFETEQFVELRNKFKNAKIDAESFVPNKFIIDRAKVSEKKAYPTRWVITALSLVSAFIATVVMIIIIENFKKFKLELKT